MYGEGVPGDRKCCDFSSGCFGFHPGDFGRPRARRASFRRSQNPPRQPKIAPRALQDRRRPPPGGARGPKLPKNGSKKAPEKAPRGKYRPNPFGKAHISSMFAVLILERPRRSKRPPRSPQCGPREPKMATRGSQRATRWPKGPPKRAQDCHKRAPRGRKRRRLQGFAPADCPRDRQGAPEMTQEASKKPREAPKMLPRGLRETFAGRGRRWRRRRMLMHFNPPHSPPLPLPSSILRKTLSATASTALNWIKAKQINRARLA